MEVPEIFRVLGKCRPEFVRPFVEQLQQIPVSVDSSIEHLFGYSILSKVPFQGFFCRKN